ncbi:MAG: sugar phosphate isomerase/epimerase family protein [Tumebacillaceae bacterium]
MKYNICSISFRHELVSFRELIRFAHDIGFAGIELWGVHARSLKNAHRANVAAVVAELAERGLCVSMISDYVDLHAAPTHYPSVLAKLDDLIALAREFGTDKIRIFAGSRGSATATPVEWQLAVKRLRQMAERTQEHGIQLVIETHPETYADSLASTMRLLAEVDHPSLRVNVDFLHVWEAGDDLMPAYRTLQPYAVNYHFKNVSQRSALGVFAPLNVYSPNGTREGITRLADGAIDFVEVVRTLTADETPYSASIEWFGPQPFDALQRELAWLRDVESRVLSAEAVK